MNSRIKQLRLALGKSQEEFAKSIGLSKSGISAIESSTRNVTDKHIRMLVLTYNVNEEWLRSGIGNMFAPADDSYLHQLQKQHHLSPNALNLISNFLSLTTAEQDDFITLASKVFNLEAKNTGNKTDIKLVSSNNYDDKDDYQILAADTAADKPIIIHTDEDD